MQTVLETFVNMPSAFSDREAELEASQPGALKKHRGFSPKRHKFYGSSRFSRARWKVFNTWLHSGPPQPPVLPPKPAIRKILHVTTDFFHATALFERRNDAWRCLAVQHPIRWLKSTPFSQVTVNLLKMGARWQWESVPANTTPDALGASRPATWAEDGALQIKPHDNLTPDALPPTGERVARSENPAPLSASKAESISLQTGSPRESSSLPLPARVNYPISHEVNPSASGLSLLVEPTAGELTLQAS